MTTSILSSKQVAKARKTQELNLPETAYIQRQATPTENEHGTVDVPWKTIATVNARLGEPKGEMERVQASKLETAEVNVITMPASTALLETDQIQINGINYRVQWMNRNKSTMTALRVLVSKAG